MFWTKIKTANGFPVKQAKTIVTRNAMRCNNRDDLLHFAHFENLNIFRGLYITQSKICDGAYIARI